MKGEKFKLFLSSRLPFHHALEKLVGKCFFLSPGFFAQVILVVGF
jgi:hypothetical protein